MSKKFYDIDEAASVLGLDPAKVNEMRTRNEIRGFRDGATWKFRAEEVEKVAADLKSKPPADDDDGDIGLAADPSESEGGSVLLSERELGSAPTTSSTIIGKSPSKGTSESDIRLADIPRGDEGSKAGGSDVKLAAHSDILRSKGAPADAGASALGLGSAIGLGGSEILAGGSQVNSGSGVGAGSEIGSDLGLQFEELDSLELDFDDAGKSGAGAAPPAEKGAGKKSALAGPGPSDSTLQLADDEAALSGSGSGARKAGGSDMSGSALDLSGDDDLVLGGSGSDVTGKPGDSGISLMDPSDSGLSLDEPLDITGSQIDGGSLVLGEDDMIMLGGSSADVSAATQLRTTDDDFLLTPSSKSGGDESESGSQVIALDSIEGFDDDAATQVGSPAAMRMLEEDISGADTMVGGPMAAAAAPGLAGAPGMMMAPVLPEAPFSIWNVLAMFVCVAVLCLVGMMMTDLVRNMWNWEHGTYTVNSGLMDALIEMFFKKS